LHRSILISLFVIIGFSAISQETFPDKPIVRKFYGQESYLIEGTAFADSLKENPFDRLPISCKEKIPPAVWELSKCSSGLSVHFITNSTSIKIKWNLMNHEKNNINMANFNNMAATGAFGVDLYCRINGNWQYINTARPSGSRNDFLLIENMQPLMREYKMFLPLFDCVTKLRIGIDSAAEILKPEPATKLPIVFYGTSITQGSAASRPGMAYVNIISRRLNTNIVNFGFSSNGLMDSSIAKIMSGLDAAFYVIDGTANISSFQIEENALSLVKILRSKHPDTPIVFVEGLMTEKGFLDDTTNKMINEKNQTLYNEYKNMLSKGFRHVYYVSNHQLSSPDHEGTVDGVHLTDLGATRFAEYLIRNFKKMHLKVDKIGGNNGEHIGTLR
jgi:hypothetical protein